MIQNFIQPRKSYPLQRLTLSFFAFLLIVILIVPFKSYAEKSAPGATSSSTVTQLIEGWSYTLGFVPADQAKAANWIKLDDVSNTSIPIETKEFTLATFHITLPDSDCKSCYFSIYHYTRVFDVYLGDQLVYTHSGGYLSNHLDMARPPLLIQIPYTKNNNQLYIVTNHYQRSFPLNQPIYFGESNQIIKMIYEREQFAIMIGAFILLMGIIAFMLYLSLARDQSFLFLGLCAFHIGIYFFSQTDIIQYFYDLPSVWGFLEYFLTYTMPITTWMYFRQFVPKNRYIDFAIIGINSIFSAFSILGLFFNISIYNWSDDQRYLFMITLLIGLFAIIRSARIGNKEAKYALVSFAMVCFITLLSMILQAIYYNPININPLAGALFISTQLIVLTLRFRRMNEELKIRSENLRTMNERLVEMNQIKDSIISNTSHELRTPLHGIIGLAESMIDVPNPAKFNYNKNLQLIATSGRRLQKLIEDILEFSNIRNRNIELMKTPVTLKDCVDAVIELLRPNVAFRPIEISNEIPADFPAVLADSNRLQQMLNHLIGNAMKFTDQGSITIFATHDENEAQIHIKDTGIGISESQMERIFELFEQGDLRTERMYGGTGLGLALTRELAEAHHGKVACESVLGQGSTFILTLPLAKNAEND